MGNNGVIYILTNRSFPDYVKIGYADDMERRLKDLNRSECMPFAFRVYATYEVNSKLSDAKIHSIIDKLNPNLCTVEIFNGDKVERSFYVMRAEDAYLILEAMAEVHNARNKLKIFILDEDTEESPSFLSHISKINRDKQFSDVSFNYSTLSQIISDGIINADAKINKPIPIKSEKLSFGATFLKLFKIVFRPKTLPINSDAPMIFLSLILSIIFQALRYCCFLLAIALFLLAVCKVLWLISSFSLLNISVIKNANIILYTFYCLFTLMFYRIMGLIEKCFEQYKYPATYILGYSAVVFSFIPLIVDIVKNFYGLLKI